MSHQKLNFKSKLNTECLRYLQGCGQRSLCVAPKYKAFLKDDTGWSLGGDLPAVGGPSTPHATLGGCGLPQDTVGACSPGDNETALKSH
jgi:hypothetical protein